MGLITPNCALLQPAAGVRWGVAGGFQTVKNPIPGELKVSQLSPYQLCQASWGIEKALEQPNAMNLGLRPYVPLWGGVGRGVRGRPRGSFGSDTGSSKCFLAAGI